MTIDLEGTIMSKYTFENFVVGKNNEFAYKIAKSVAEKKMSYNLFFIYGDVQIITTFDYLFVLFVAQKKFLNFRSKEIFLMKMLYI